VLVMLVLKAPVERRIPDISYIIYNITLCYVIYYNNRVIHISHINCGCIIQIFAKTEKSTMERSKKANGMLKYRLYGRRCVSCRQIAAGEYLIRKMSSSGGRVRNPLTFH
jgi:hypothetical protein